MPLTAAELGSFFVLTIGLALVPGPNLAVVLRSASQGGQRAAWATATGLTLSKMLWAAASLVGVAQILNASANLYSALRLAGALYLVAMGVGTLRRRSSTPDAAPVPRGDGSMWWAVRAGAISDVLNPKVGAFYLAVFPTFIGPDDSVLLAASVLFVAHACVLMAYYPLMAALSLRARSMGRGFVDRIVGIGLVGAGLALAWDLRR